LTVTKGPLKGGTTIEILQKAFDDLCENISPRLSKSAKFLVLRNANCSEQEAEHYCCRATDVFFDELDKRGKFRYNLVYLDIWDGLEVSSMVKDYMMYFNEVNKKSKREHKAKKKHGKSGSYDEFQSQSGSYGNQSGISSNQSGSYGNQSGISSNQSGSYGNELGSYGTEGSQFNQTIKNPITDSDKNLPSGEYVLGSEALLVSYNTDSDLALDSGYLGATDSLQDSFDDATPMTRFSDIGIPKPGCRDLRISDDEIGGTSFTDSDNEVVIYSKAIPKGKKEISLSDSNYENKEKVVNGSSDKSSKSIHDVSGSNDDNLMDYGRKVVYKKDDFLSSSQVQQVLTNDMIPLIDHYKIRKRKDPATGEMVDWVLGKGQFGCVYCGIVGGYPVAIKTLLNQPSEKQIIDFVAEMKLMLTVKHPNIVGLMGVYIPVSNTFDVF